MVSRTKLSALTTFCPNRILTLVLSLLALSTCTLLAVAQPPRKPPPEALPKFTMNNSVAIEYFYVDDTLNGASTHYIYSQQDIEKMIKGTLKLLSRYDSSVLTLQQKDPLLDPLLELPVPPAHWIYVSLLRYHRLIEGGRVCVVGSSSPWVEAAALALGAELVVVLEYNTLTYAHPSLVTITGDQMEAALSVDSPWQGSIDVVVAASSLDHDGLGRYGDPLAPDADLAASARLRGLLKRRGILLLSVPVGADMIVFNTLRRYGPLRLPLLLEPYRIKERLGWEEGRLLQAGDWRRSYEPVFVLERADGNEDDVEREL